MSVTASSQIHDPEIREILRQKDERNAALEADIVVLKEQLAWLKKQIFGSKSERIVTDLGIQPLLPDISQSRRK